MVKHMAAIDWRQVGDLMVALERVSTVGSMAARFTILTAARAEETRGATWVKSTCRTRMQLCFRTKTAVSIVTRQGRGETSLPNG